MNLKKINAELNKKLTALGKIRDDLRSLADEANELAETSEDAYNSLESAIDRISEIV